MEDSKDSSALFIPEYSSKTAEETLPTYEDLEKDGLATGPVHYKAPISLKILLALYCCFKFIVGMGLFLIWGFQVTDYATTRFVTLSVFVSFFCLLLMLPWPVSGVFCRHHMTLSRYELKYLMRSWWFYCFLFEQLVLLTMDLVGGISWKYTPIPFLGSALLIAVNCAAFWIVTHHECFDHQPLFRENDHVLASATATKDTPFKIITSSAFKIVFENVGYQTISGEFTVIRKIGEKGYRGKLSFYHVQFPLTLINVAPGERITCIPETHSLPGAIAIPDFRSFGMDTGNSVTTSLHKGSLYSKSFLKFHCTHS